MLRKLLSLFLLVVVAGAQAQERVRDVIYAKVAGAAFTMDVFKPKTPNGAGVIFIVSGGWFSSHDSINLDIAKVMNDHGYTVFEVVHGSQPKYTIPEIAQMITRAVRFVHANAKTYGVDDKQLLLSGASAGGHLSLLTAARGDNGDPDAKDPVDQAPSTVSAVAVYFPPTDFLNYGGEGIQPGQSDQFKPYAPAFGIPIDASKDDIRKILAADSPITYITSAFPPTLIIHGDKDSLVPLQQSERFRDAVNKLGGHVELFVVPGGGHDAVTLAGGILRFLAFVDQHLK